MPVIKYSNLSVILILIVQCLFAFSSLQAEDQKLHYEIRRKGDEVGSLKVRIETSDQGVRIEYDLDMRIRILFVSVYSMARDQVMQLDKEGRIVSVESKTVVSGRENHVSLVRNEGGFLLEVNDQQRQLAKDAIIMTSLHPFLIPPVSGVWLHLSKGELQDTVVQKLGAMTYHIRHDQEEELLTYGQTGYPEKLVFTNEDERIELFRIRNSENNQ